MPVRFLVSLSREQWNRLLLLAHREYREPRKQFEFLVHRALDALEAEAAAVPHREPAHVAAK